MYVLQILPQEFLKIFTPDQLSLLLSGVPFIDVDDWERNTEVQLYCYDPNNKNKNIETREMNDDTNALLYCHTIINFIRIFN